MGDETLRLFMLGGDGAGYEIPLDWYERYQGEPVDPRFRDRAMEIAPGVWVTELSEGGGIGPGGDLRTFGARIAVWHAGKEATDDQG